MRTSFISAVLASQIITSYAAPHPIEVIQNIDWEKELLGRSDDGLEKRARSEKSIDAVFKSIGKQYFGTCADQNRLSGTNADVLLADFGQVTPENSGKWDTTEPQQGKFNFQGLDALVNWAQSNNKLVRGHTTLWYSQLPSWVSAINNKATLTSVIQTHVSTEIGRYAGKVLQWDVVNEIFNEDGTLRNSVFHNVLGEDFVSIAFAAAKKADPKAKLYINDYNTVEKGSTYAKTTGMITYVKKWIAAGVPIDGIGAQAHLQSGESKNVPASLKELCAIVSECAMTEVDIVNAAASEYVTTIKSCADIANCVGVTVWGIRDPDSWRASSNPLLFDSNYNTKPAYSALIQTLGSYSTAKATTTASATGSATGNSTLSATATPTQSK